MADLIGRYTILGSGAGFPDSAEPQTFEVPATSDQPIQVVVDYGAKAALATVRGIPFDEETCAKLEGLHRFEGDKLDDVTYSELHRLFSSMRNAVRYVLSLLKYHHKHYGISEGCFSIKAEQIYVAENRVYEVPSRPSIVWDNYSHFPLSNESSAFLQQSIEAGVVPLEAMKYLHRARIETVPHYKWIDATIAAELAVKEILCRAKPEIAPLLVELPTPPISKLYGRILKEYLGEESPYRNALVKGQEKRNELVHRPTKSRVDSQDANEYAQNVEAAIFHLLSLLYPYDSLIDREVGVDTAEL